MNNYFKQEAAMIIPGQNYSFNELRSKVFFKTEEYANTLNRLLALLKDDLQYIRTLNKKQVLKYNEKAEWLFSDFSTLKYAVNYLT